MWKEEPEVLAFLQRIVAMKQSDGQKLKVLELGSYAMHDHNPRPLWPGAEYTGVDNRPGPGVDVVGLAHELAPKFGGSVFDVVLSVSALEHDPHWEQTIETAFALVRPGGVIAITCAGPGWQEHERECSPVVEGAHWYQNLSVNEVAYNLTWFGEMSMGQTFEKPLKRLEAYYVPRMFSPHWPRTCVIAQF